MKRSGPVSATGVALAASGTVVVGTLALTETFSVLPAAVVAYAAAWWMWGLEDPSPRIPEEETPMTTRQHDSTAPERVEDQRPVEPTRIDAYRVPRAAHPADLMVRRPDLYGVSKLADVAADSVLWSA